jgi:hypothetical protein
MRSTSTSQPVGAPASPAVSAPETRRGAIQLTKCLWIQKGFSIEANRICAGYARSLQELSVRVEHFRDPEDQEGIERITRLLRQSDDHVVLFYMGPSDLRAFGKVLIERGNYTLIADDWWLTPHVFFRHAEYVLFRCFGAFAVRLGLGPFARFGEAALLEWPSPLNSFGLGMLATRMASLGLCPILEMAKAIQRKMETTPLDRLIYFPYPIRAEDVQYRETAPQYDFSNVGNLYGPWLMRDPFAPSWFAGANLYSDRRRIVEAMLAWDGRPYAMLNWYGRNRMSLYDELCQVVRQSRLTVATGGIQQNLVPKYIEFACLGTPMVGRFLPYEHPWLDQCLFPIDPLTVTRENIRPQLEQALALQPKLKEGCLRVRQQLLKLYCFENCLRVAQEQIDGRPIPPGYLKVNFRSGAPGPPVPLGRYAGAEAN